MENAKRERLILSTDKSNPYTGSFKTAYHQEEVYMCEARVMYSTGKLQPPFVCKQASVFPIPEGGFDIKKMMDILYTMYPDLEHIELRIHPEIVKA